MKCQPAPKARKVKEKKVDWLKESENLTEE
jgi:hypothetical protein